MHDDLRRKALESGKTVSKKAQSKQSSRGSSRGNSAPNSRAASRVQSRDVSDDEDLDKGNLSDETTQRYRDLRSAGLPAHETDTMAHSINSIDALLETDDINEYTTDQARFAVNNVIDEILDRKGSSTQAREHHLTVYAKYVASHYLADVLYNRVEELLPAFLRSIKAESSETETTTALRALALTAITYAAPSLYETVSSALKRSIADSQSAPVKAAAIYSLGICTVFGGAGDDEILDVMTFLHEVVASDGAFVNADDSVEVVAAALHTYGLLATEVDDLEHESEDAVTTFLDQLDADNAKVQIAAGENIALLFEKCYTPREEDDESSEEEDESPEEELSDRPHIQSYLIKRYNPYHNAKEVVDKVNALASLSTKSMNRRDKRSLHQAFATIALTVEDPRSGLQSNNASKMVVRIHREGEMRVDKWWKLMRLNAVRRLLGSGFVNHYFEGNKQVLDALPMIMRGVGEAGMQSPRKMPANKAAKGKYRDQRRFISANYSEN
ncbi:IFRD domain protein [Cladophialophora carrionii]|uniref:IFRD domain protein n=1 Tax=Cladophialophora carrionii TaxID=86049 RepID=A0A1C1CG96_9EURO|nr:IFRD domain protein [Cladophialophora carrionii]